MAAIREPLYTRGGAIVCGVWPALGVVLDDGRGGADLSIRRFAGTTRSVGPSESAKSRQADRANRRNLPF
jgi:hypothetical protein